MGKKWEKKSGFYDIIKRVELQLRLLNCSSFLFFIDQTKKGNRFFGCLFSYLKGSVTVPNIKDIFTQQKIADAKLQGMSDEQAVIAAGYSKRYAAGNAYKVVGNSGIQRLIAEGAKRLHNKGIATAEDIQKFWTETVSDPNCLRTDRLRASELLAKAQGMFTQKVDINGSVPVTIVDDVSE